MTERSERKEARKKAGNDDGSQAGSEFSAATIAAGTPLWKHWTAASSLSRLVTEWLTGNLLLRQGEAALTEEQLVVLIYRFFKKMQCSKSGNFGDAREYSIEIYEKLMSIMWSDTKARRNFIPRKWDTFCALFCATGSYAAAIAWLAQYVVCEQHPRGQRSPHEIAVIQFMFVCAALGVNAATSCTKEILGALFMHIFNGADLGSIPADMRHTMRSAIDKVKADFATEPVQVPAPVPEPVQCVHQVQHRQQSLRGRGNHAGGGAVARHSTEHHASPNAKQQEIEQMMQMMQSKPGALARFQEFLANQPK
jgi:hypothetical protein